MSAFTVPGLPDTGRCLVMGVVNVTPDSFSDGGRWADPESAIAHGQELLAQGADILDIGGESIPYIAGWGEDGALDAIRDYAQTIDAIARAKRRSYRSRHASPRSSPRSAMRGRVSAARPTTISTFSDTPARSRLARAWMRAARACITVPFAESRSALSLSSTDCGAVLMRTPTAWKPKITLGEDMRGLSGPRRSPLPQAVLGRLSRP